MLEIARLRSLLLIISHGFEGAVLVDPGLAEAVFSYGGKLTDERVGNSIGLESYDLAELMAEKAKEARERLTTGQSPAEESL